MKNQLSRQKLFEDLPEEDRKYFMEYVMRPNSFH